MNALKDALSDQTYLSFFVRERTTILVADAGPNALGAVLMQRENDIYHTISYASKSLSDREKKYYQTEKEALALIWGCEKFQIYLTGVEFELWTDCKSLEFLFKPTSKPCARLERWILRLQSFSFKVIHHPGKLNIADPLSRLCSPNESNEISNECHMIRLVCDTVYDTTPTAVSPKEIEQETVKDPQLEEVKKALKTGNWSKVEKAFVQIKDQICQVGELLLKQEKLIVPATLRKRVLESAHSGHIGVEAMKARLRTKVWFPGVDKAVESRVKECMGCIMTSLENAPTPMSGRMLPERPWEYVALDFKEGLPDGKSILVAIDYFSKYVEMALMTDTSATEMVICLKAMNARYGNPSRYTVDNGPQFISDVFKKFCQDQLIEIEATTPYKANMNGEVERFNRNIKKRIQIAHVENKDYRDALWDYLQTYHNTIHSAIGTTPSVMMFGHPLRDNIPGINKHSTDILLEDIVSNHNHKKKVAIERENQKRKAKPTNVEVGDTVVSKNFGVKPGYVPRFGPSKYRIIERNGSRCVLSSNDSSNKLIRDSSHLRKVPSDHFEDGEGNAGRRGKEGDATGVSRSGRTLKRPSKFHDYVNMVEFK